MVLVMGLIVSASVCEKLLGPVNTAAKENGSLVALPDQGIWTSALKPVVCGNTSKFTSSVKVALAAKLENDPVSGVVLDNPKAKVDDASSLRRTRVMS